ncbi:MAG: hypothetical protein ACRDDM_08695 [Paraclostridium sp.]
MLSSAITQAKKAISSLYNGLCTIYEYKEVTDPNTKRTTHKELLTLENQPCRLSFKNITQSKDGDISKLTQVIKLFIDTDCEVAPGSKIVVTQNNVTTEYKNSGQPAIYTSHKEIILELFKGWS